MKKDKLMNLEIQLFAEADNDSAIEVESGVATGEEELEFSDYQEPENTSEVENINRESEKNQDITQTQVFSRRLKEETEKIKNNSKKQMDSFAISRGFKNWDDMLEYNEKEQISQMGIEDQEAFNKFLDEKIKNNPTVIEAQKILEEQKNAQIEKVINDEIHLISEVDPSIKSLDDLAKIPEYDDVMDKAVNRGYSLSDAFKVVAFNRIQNKAKSDSKQSAIDNINSKNHFKTVSGKGSNEIFVPAEIMATYRKNLPDMSEEEIRKNYASFLKGGE